MMDGEAIDEALAVGEGSRSTRPQSNEPGGTPSHEGTATAATPTPPQLPLGERPKANVDGNIDAGKSSQNICVPANKPGAFSTNESPGRTKSKHDFTESEASARPRSSFEDRLKRKLESNVNEGDGLQNVHAAASKPGAFPINEPPATNPKNRVAEASAPVPHRRTLFQDRLKRKVDSDANRGDGHENIAATGRKPGEISINESLDTNSKREVIGDSAVPRNSMEERLDGKIDVSGKEGGGPQIICVTEKGPGKSPINGSPGTDAEHEVTKASAFAIPCSTVGDALKRKLDSNMNQGRGHQDTLATVKKPDELSINEPAGANAKNGDTEASTYRACSTFESRLKNKLDDNMHLGCGRRDIRATVSNHGGISTNQRPGTSSAHSSYEERLKRKLDGNLSAGGRATVSNHGEFSVGGSRGNHSNQTDSTAAASTLPHQSTKAQAERELERNSDMGDVCQNTGSMGSKPGAFTTIESSGPNSNHRKETMSTISTTASSHGLVVDGINEMVDNNSDPNLCERNIGYSADEATSTNEDNIRIMSTSTKQRNPSDLDEVSAAQVDEQLGARESIQDDDNREDRIEGRDIGGNSEEVRTSDNQDLMQDRSGLPGASRTVRWNSRLEIDTGAGRIGGEIQQLDNADATLDNSEGQVVVRASDSTTVGQAVYSVRRAWPTSSVTSTLRWASRRQDTNQSGIQQNMSHVIIPEAFPVNDSGRGHIGSFVIQAEQINGFWMEQRTKRICCLIWTTVLSVIIALVVVLYHKWNSPPSNGFSSDDDCKPCIDRTAYKLRAIFHGTSDDIYWQQIAASARQSALDMQVELELELYPPGGFTVRQMADDIRAAADPASGVNALVLTIPNKEVTNAVRYAAGEGIPIFGLNSGFEQVSGNDGLINDGTVLFFTSMDERRGGKMAASYFLDNFSSGKLDQNATGLNFLSGNYSRALFISPRHERISAYRERFKGFRDRLEEVSNGTIDVRWFEVDTSSPDALDANLQEKLKGCAFQSVLFGSGKYAPALVNAIEAVGCQHLTKAGTFDMSIEISQQIADQKMEFSVHQNLHTQGWAAVHFAALYVTTGQFLPPPDEVYLSGPIITTLKNQPEPAFCHCIQDAFPICQNSQGLDGMPSRCPCFDRKTILIGGVVHGTTPNEFWDTVFGGAKQGASDMGVELMFDRFRHQNSSELLDRMMAERVLDLCDVVDGLFVSLPDKIVVDAVKSCADLRPEIPIVSINAGFADSKEIGLMHHIGEVEKDAGYRAGKKMESMATLNHVLCLHHDPKLQVFLDRCDGFGVAMDEMAIDYMGQVVVQHDNITDYVSKIESAIGESGDWRGYGILLAASENLAGALVLKEDHPNLVIATFDVYDLLHDEISAGNILFAVDQQPYLEGYLPIPLLTHAVISKQSFLDHHIKTGPKFVISAPDIEDCVDDPFAVCDTSSG